MKLSLILIGISCCITLYRSVLSFKGRFCLTAFIASGMLLAVCDAMFHHESIKGVSEISLAATPEVYQSAHLSSSKYRLHAYGLVASSAQMDREKDEPGTR